MNATLDLDALAQRTLAMCKERGWSTEWPERGCYLHLEVSELIEACRGKKGTVEGEAADVAFVLLTILAKHGVSPYRMFELVEYYIDNPKPGLRPPGK